MKQPGPTTTSTVLVVEDDPLVRATALALLETQGYAVIEAPTAEVALQVLGAQAGISLLFTDVHFPGLHSGVSLASQVHQRWPEVALLVTSGRRPVSLAELPPGARFIAKPYRASMLFSEVADLLEARAGCSKGVPSAA
jgi:CheY-like chemotaxis protein